MLNWQHESLPLRIGGGVYIFRTLSLYQANELAPLLPQLQAAVEASEPLKVAEASARFVEIVCPEFLKSEDFNKLTAKHVEALTKFYLSQDWGRIRAMLALGGGEAAEPEGDAEQTRERNRDVFVRLCIWAAEKTNMSPVEFANQRFEYCADVIMEIHKRHEDSTKNPNAISIDAFRKFAEANFRVN